MIFKRKTRLISRKYNFQRVIYNESLLQERMKEIQYISISFSLVTFGNSIRHVKHILNGKAH